MSLEGVTTVRKFGDELKPSDHVALQDGNAVWSIYQVVSRERVTVQHESFVHTANRSIPLPGEVVRAFKFALLKVSTGETSSFTAVDEVEYSVALYQ